MRGYKERAAPYGFPWETSHRPIDPICYMTFFILSLLILFFNLMQLPSENSHTSILKYFIPYFFFYSLHESTVSLWYRVILGI